MFKDESSDNIIENDPEENEEQNRKIKSADERCWQIQSQNEQKELGLINILSQENAPDLFSLKDGVGSYLSDYLSKKDLSTLTKTCCFFYNIFESKLSKYKKFYEPLLQILLQHIATATKEDITVIKSMLEKNPELLSMRGDIQDLAGNWIRNVAPYEFILGAGDDELAYIIAPYFARFNNGELERQEQSAKYKPFIDNMLNKKYTYNFKPILQSILDADEVAVQTALACKFDEEKYPLHAELAKFRKDFSPREITKGMHFNYVNLIALYNIGRNYTVLPGAKYKLFRHMLIGFAERRLSAIDRQIFAQGVYYIVKEGEKSKRSFDFRYSEGSFPVTRCDMAYEGPGYTWSCCDVVDELGFTFLGGRKVYIDGPDWVLEHITNKKNKLAALMPQPEHVSRCVIS